MKRFTEKQVKELAEEVARGSRNAQYSRRVQALYCVAVGETTIQAGALTMLNKQTVRRLKRQYFIDGLEGLKSKYKGANYRKLSFAKEAEALEKLSTNAALGEYVRSKELMVEFEKLTGVSYHINAFRQLLKRHGWRKVAPRGAHPKKASDEAIEASKKLTLWSSPKNQNYPQKTVL